MKHRLAIVLGFAIVMLHGCASDPTRPDADDGTRADRAGAPAAEARGAWIDGVWVEDAAPGEGSQIHPLEDPESSLAQRVVYFPFDSSELSVEDRALLAAHARFLAAHPKVSIILEGHTDERGSREYNLALGERRGVSVQQVLLLNGVSRDQLQVISFGEERPVAMGGNERAWSLNRRVELLYSGH